MIGRRLAMAVALAAVVAVVVDLPVVVRAPLALALFLACPGLAVLPVIGGRDPLLDALVVVATSVATTILAASALVLLGVLSPVAGTVAVAAVCVGLGRIRPFDYGAWSTPVDVGLDP